jgi:hypothetical protein
MNSDGLGRSGTAAELEAANARYSTRREPFKRTIFVCVHGVALRCRYKDILTYFGVWKPPPTAVPRLAYYRDALFPALEYEQLKTSCAVRGKDTAAKNKIELLDVRHTHGLSCCARLLSEFGVWLGSASGARRALRVCVCASSGTPS